jgi:ribonuclease HII
MVSFATYEIESDLKDKGYEYIVGVDESGRGCLSGAVVAAACFIPESMIPSLLTHVKDSKKLTAKKREELFPLIKNNCNIGIGVVSNKIIDEINILNATKLAMEEALSYFVNPIPDYVLIDGTVKLDNLPIQQEQVIRGDSKSISIAAASIIAKVVRDRIMDDLHDIWSFYGWNKNRGYGTKYHTEAIETYGPCEVHRMTFKRVKEYCNE